MFQNAECVKRCVVTIPPILFPVTHFPSTGQLSHQPLVYPSRDFCFLIVILNWNSRSQTVLFLLSLWLYLGHSTSVREELHRSSQLLYLSLYGCNHLSSPSWPLRLFSVFSIYRHCYSEVNNWYFKLFFYLLMTVHLSRSVVRQHVI